MTRNIAMRLFAYVLALLTMFCSLAPPAALAQEKNAPLAPAAAVALPATIT